MVIVVEVGTIKNGDKTELLVHTAEAGVDSGLEQGGCSGIRDICGGHTGDDGAFFFNDAVTVDVLIVQLV